jgi:hypothetical protein
MITVINTDKLIRTKIKKLRSLFIYIVLLFFTFGYCNLQANEKHIAVVTRPGWSGELEFAYRIHKAGSNLGWKVDIVDFKDSSINTKQYDFVLCLVPDAFKSNHHTYLTLFDPKSHFFKESGSLAKEYRSYTGYLLTYEPNHRSKSFAEISKHPWMKWYPSSQLTEYNETDPSHLFYVCSNWSQRSSDPRYKILLTLLNSQYYTRLYGLGHFKDLYPESYVSFIPVDGESMLQEINNSGIALVLHSLIHLDSAIPSGRIFEAVASSSVVICDKNPFVMQHFGDSVLYIEQNSSGYEIFKQIDNHVNWILEHKEEAKAMAKKAHSIYLEKFTLENQLSKLEELHDNYVQNKK